MSVKRHCDRCETIIHPNSTTPHTIITVGFDKGDRQSYDLCVSCAYRLKKWLKRDWVLDNEEVTEA